MVPPLGLLLLVPNVHVVIFVFFWQRVLWLQVQEYRDLWVGVSSLILSVTLGKHGFADGVKTI